MLASLVIVPTLPNTFRPTCVFTRSATSCRSHPTLLPITPDDSWRMPCALVLATRQMFSSVEWEPRKIPDQVWYRNYIGSIIWQH